MEKNGKADQGKAPSGKKLARMEDLVAERDHKG